MKIFIIFTGLLLINVCAISYQGDFARYISLERTLDDIAFECAETAAHSMDETEAQMYAEERLAYAAKTLGDMKIRDSRCEIYFEDGFAVVYIRMDVEELFRFPNLPVTSVVAERKLPT
jgi:hypothetical protein